ncbi:Lrp/AsnC family transcriptional regulator [Alkalimarinus sediminis]|uniref:Siroheme decarboxylase NirG subunit n=1 Tax=Alkalimarinus sediminis TaxID=1632866 RepID=A0A9E8KR81_9ALTE|nr:AsnC family transcriptional regulator [Alkalimarinus sediminis]UZW75742.1 AsnC family transcriptional regulator [Alkalimarinus sediminis]
MDEIDRSIINQLQRGFPICERPYEEAANSLGISEADLIGRIESLLEDKTLTRFGPMYQIEKAGGAFTLAAMSIPEDEFDKVAEQVNQFPEIAHNYERVHKLNMWFVLGTESPEEIASTIERIEQETGYKVYNMPKLEEFYVGLYFPV